MAAVGDIVVVTFENPATRNLIVRPAIVVNGSGSTVDVEILGIPDGITFNRFHPNVTQASAGTAGTQAAKNQFNPTALVAGPLTL
jgi:hypothetical protein